MSKNFKKIFYLNLKHKFKKTSCITQAHFDVLRMLISAKRRLGLSSNSGRLVSAYRRLMASGGSLPRVVQLDSTRMHKQHKHVVPGRIYTTSLQTGQYGTAYTAYTCCTGSDLHYQCADWTVLVNAYTAYTYCTGSDHATV